MTSGLTAAERKFLKLALAYSRDADSVVLVGSVARATRMTGSGDLDLLIVNGRGRKLLHPGVQTTVVTKEDLARRVLSGDDFAQWALRFGVPLSGRSRWKELRTEMLRHAPWPSPQIKQKHAARRLTRARELLAMNDCDAAREELSYATNHLARSRLLHLRIFPLSRPELPTQLIAAGEHRLARLLESLHAEGDIAFARLERHLASVEEFLTEEATTS